MSDAFRTGDSRAIDVASDADRDAKIERLLVAGLDHYFAARYEQAINVWTRALFFDRGHPRARAYIDRARSALAERQRESEELLQQGVAAFRNGERDEARRLLQAAISNGAPPEEAQTLLDRLHSDRESGVPGAVADAEPRVASTAPTSFSGRTKVAPSSRDGTSNAHLGLVLVGVLAVVAVLGVYVLAVRAGRDSHAITPLRDSPVGSAAAPATRDVALPLPRRGEMALQRARLLASGGRLHEALAALDLVRPTDPQRPEADRVRADIQHQLLGHATIPRSPAAGRAR